MDPLTEKLLERARARRENLARKMAETSMSPRKMTSTCRMPLKENQELVREATMSGRNAGLTSPKKQRSVEATIKPDTPSIPSVKSRLQRLAEQRQMWNSSNGTEVDSPQNVIPPSRRDLEVEDERDVQVTQAAPISSRSRFAALAASINSWEDDTNHPRHQFQMDKPTAKKWQTPIQTEPHADLNPIPAKRSAPVAPSDLNTTEETAPSMQPSPPKRAKHEEEVALKREPSGSVGSCTDTSSDSAAEQPIPAPRVTLTTAAVSPRQSPIKTHVTSASPVKRPTLQSCTAATPKIQSPRKQPITGQCPKKVTFKESPVKKSPMKSSPTKKSPQKQPAIRPSPIKQQANKSRNVIPRKGATCENFARAMALLEQGCSGGGASSRLVTSPIQTQPKVGAMAKRIQDRLKEHQDNWQKNEINKKIQEERRKEMAIIKSRWNCPKSNPNGQTEKPVDGDDDNGEDEMEEEEEMYEGEDHGMDEEQMEDEEIAEDDETETSLYSTTEDEEVHPECNTEENSGIVSMTIEKRATPLTEEYQQEEKADESEVNISDVLGDIDDLIVEAEQAMKEEEEAAAKASSLERDTAPPTVTMSTHADTSGWDYDIDTVEPVYATVTKHTNSSSVSEEEPTPAPRVVRTSSSASSSDESTCSSFAPHSLESYRSQQKEVTKSPVTVTHRTVTRETAARTVVREASTSSRASSSASSRSNDRGRHPGNHPKRASRQDATKKGSTRDKIQTLMEEVSAQQSIIHQTSQALELIAVTEEYHGTKEEIEAERLLVVATQRRQACLSEIQYMKNPVAKSRVIVTEDGEEIVPCKGSVTIKDIRLPLKTQYLMALDSGRDQVHHSFFVIVKCHEVVIATQILSTRNVTGDCLHFTNLVCLNDLGSDFTVELFVYEMRGRCATMDAVHSKKATSKHGWSLTPKKFKTGASTSRQGGRYPQSPAPSGHSTVRQNSFATVGSVRLTLASSQLKKVTLSKVPFLSPLEGSIHLTMSCHTNSQTHAEGFLTMFDDCSGLGMWHRRWCVLHGGNLSYWKYPGDEKRKPPIGTVDLKECITPEVRLISRIHCARPNTFELQTSRPSCRADRDTLVSRHDNSNIITKHLLSADTKEDRLEWTTALNKTLLELRLWCEDAARPSRE